MGQANYSAFYKWKKVWEAGLLETKHGSMIWQHNCLIPVRDGPLHSKPAVTTFLETFKNWLPLDNFDNEQWIGCQWVEMFLKTCASEIRETRKKDRWGMKQLVMDLGERVSKTAKSNLPQLPNTTFMVVIRWVSNGKDKVLAPKQLLASYTDVKHWEELIAYINKNGRPKDPYMMTLMFKCTLMQDKLEEEYMGFYTNRQMIMDRINGQISYNYCLSKAFKLKLGHNPKIFLVEIKWVTE